MTAKQKAEELANKFVTKSVFDMDDDELYLQRSNAKKHAITCIDEIIGALEITTGHLEINKLGENEYAEIEVNGAVFVGGNDSQAVKYLNRHSSILPEDIISIWFDGIEKVIMSEMSKKAKEIKLNRIISDLNESVEYIVDKVGLDLEFITNYNHKKPYLINIYYKNISEAATKCAEHIESLAYIALDDNEELEKLTSVNVLEYK